MDHLKAIIATHERLHQVDGRYNAARAACVELRACRVLLADVVAGKLSVGQAQDTLRARSEAHHAALQKIGGDLKVAQGAVATAERLAHKPKAQGLKP